MHKLTKNDVKLIITNHLGERIARIENGVIVIINDIEHSEQQKENREFNVDAKWGAGVTGGMTINEFEEFERKFHDELIELLSDYNKPKYPDDFYKKEERSPQPTNPHFAKEKWRRK
jgi:hypothetical protein